ncbi:thioesterase-like superfamily-domain-containing protein [Apodospora peruviana]|uniref:Thioesterase-like superfamily-domain-containing protein n=1 Tax=Apodospora peruviana TaxID=516989 RepID=A0AAE0MBI3_9PEZI|nr:thioesterase-like superfamily-domain-containing protein [Apodospora peruviana]
MTSKPAIIPFHPEAIKVDRLDLHTYAATLSETFAIGTVPNGGYVSSCILQAATVHLASRGQTDPLTCHFEFLNRTEVGPVVIVIEDIKLGRQLSTLHATLYQGSLLPQAPWISPASSRKAIVAYFTMTDLRKEKGISLPTGFSLQAPAPPPPPTAGFGALENGTDPFWVVMKPATGTSFNRALDNIVYHVPRRGQTTKSVVDVWVKLACGENFSNASLGYVADCWPYVIESYRPKTREQMVRDKVPFAPDTVFWYPTVVMNLELKKSLADGGKRWLRMRVLAKEIKNGRLDLEVLIFDAEGELVALSQHVNLILGAERNTAGRTGGEGATGQKKGESKI